MIDIPDQKKAELTAFASMSDDEINTSDIPEAPIGLMPNAACFTG